MTISRFLQGPDIMEMIMTIPMHRIPGTSARTVWLTFDDGPHPEYTDKILDVLKEYGISATFFVVGANVGPMGKAILKRVGNEGHSIGNHAYSHQDLTMLTENEIRDEIMRTDAIIAELRNAEKVFRPPYGTSSLTIDRIARELGYRKVLWNVDTRDWDPAYQPDRWVERAVSLVGQRKRSVVIAHDIHKSTADHIATMIDQIGNVTFARCTGARCTR